MSVRGQYKLKHYDWYGFNLWDPADHKKEVAKFPQLIPYTIAVVVPCTVGGWESHCAGKSCDGAAVLNFDLNMLICFMVSQKEEYYQVKEF